MTLITRLSTTFTDTTLPKLRKDPVLTDAGSLILYDFKATANQAAGFNPASPEFVNLGSYTGRTSITPALGANRSYDQSKGAIAAESDSAQISVENRSVEEIFNTTDSFLLILWASRRATNLGTFFFSNYLAKGSGTSGSGDQTISIANAGTTASNNVQMNLRLSDVTGVADTFATTAGPTTGGAPVQLAMHWFYDGTQWKAHAYSNKTKDSEEASSANPLWVAASNMALFRNLGGYGSKGSQVHRLVIENLTQSGRSATEVLNLDYAYSNGRFSS